MASRSGRFLAIGSETRSSYPGASGKAEITRKEYEMVQIVKGHCRAGEPNSSWWISG